MILKLVAPDLITHFLSDEQIAVGIRQLYEHKCEAVILLADPIKNLYMQMGCGGWHIEHCVGVEGPVYSADDIPLDLATRLFLAYKNGDASWMTAVAWKVEIEKL